MAENRNIFIINPGFQYRFCLIICSIVFVGSLIYPITIWDLFNNFINMAPEQNVEQLSASRDQLIWILMAIQLSFIGLVFALCLYMSHRIAGPMYKVSKYLREIRAGGALYPLTFREHDQFKEVAVEINETIEYLTQKSEDEIDYLQEVSAYIENISLVVPEDKKPVLNEIQKKIQEFQDSKYPTE